MLFQHTQGKEGLAHPSYGCVSRDQSDSTTQICASYHLLCTLEDQAQCLTAGMRPPLVYTVPNHLYLQPGGFDYLNKASLNCARPSLKQQDNGSIGGLSARAKLDLIHSHGYS